VERIIQASSNPGDVVLDPFCGCGTTIDAAEKLGREWIGIDVTQLAISLIKNRLQDTYGPRMKFVTGTAQGRAGSPLPADGGASVPASRLVSSLAPPDSTGAHGVTRPTESIVRIIGEPTTPSETAMLPGSLAPSHCRLTLNLQRHQMGTLYLLERATSTSSGVASRTRRWTSFISILLPIPPGTATSNGWQHRRT
jgi:hypothetical protein